MTLSLSVGSVPPLPRRSILITVIGWIAIVANSIVVPISAISFVMVLVGSYGTANMNPPEALVMIAGPPATMLAGIGLLRRWRWAWAYMLVALIGVVIWSSGQIIKGPSPARSYTSSDGVLNTVSAIEVDYLFHGTAVVVAVGLCGFLLSRSVRSEFRIGRKQPSPAGSPVGSGPPVLPAILSQPDAANRVYSNERVPRPGGAALRTPGLSAGSSGRRKQSQALLIAIVALLMIAGGMFWLVQSGIGKGETYLPSKTGSMRRIVSREAKPALFWVSIGLYAAVGGGTLSLAVWGIRAGLKEGGGCT